jgi:hypothetical protein
MEEKLLAMDAKLESTTYGGHKWEAKVIWMKRGPTRAMVETGGQTPAEAVDNLYEEYNRLLHEGWERTK